MTIISLTDCCHLLAIDPKTLRHWMCLSHLEALPHPLDARRKCLTREQLQQLAAAHRRTLETPEDLRRLPETSVLPTTTHVVSAAVLSDVREKQGVNPLSMVIHILGLFLKRLMGLRIIRKCVTSPDFSDTYIDLTKQLVTLQVHVTTLQHQLTLLNSQLQKEQQWRASVTLTTEAKSAESSQDWFLEKSLEPSLESPRDLSLEKSLELSLESSLDLSLESSQDLSLEPLKEKKQARTAANVSSIDEHRHSHVLPWVEYGAQGKYVVISPEGGLLEFEPDSPEWFAWLSTQLSFRFVGQQGRFTAHRGACLPTRGWRASRHIRNRSYNQSLGKTESLTIAALEQVAATLQSHLN